MFLTKVQDHQSSHQTIKYPEYAAGTSQIPHLAHLYPKLEANPLTADLPGMAHCSLTDTICGLAVVVIYYHMNLAVALCSSLHVVKYVFQGLLTVIYPQ